MSDGTEAARRLTAQEIFEAAKKNARDELERPLKALAFSGLAGGVTMGLTGLAVAVTRAVAGDSTGAHLLSFIFYPIGFVAVIIGRAQLFTENTLYPVILVLDERRHFRATLQLWGTVFLANVVGAGLFALLAARTSALEPKVLDELVKIGLASVGGTFGHLFWSGVIGGWIIALVAWLVTASQRTIGQVLIVWLLTFVVGIGGFAHCIATSGEILVAVARGDATIGSYLQWLLPAALGNICGGVFIVSLLNWGQVFAGSE
jgi:formate/nitrite transporter FocA (FNT family)